MRSTQGAHMPCPHPSTTNFKLGSTCPNTRLMLCRFSRVLGCRRSLLRLFYCLTNVNQRRTRDWNGTIECWRLGGLGALLSCFMVWTRVRLMLAQVEESWEIGSAGAHVHVADIAAELRLLCRRHLPLLRRCRCRRRRRCRALVAVRRKSACRRGGWARRALSCGRWRRCTWRRCGWHHSYP